MTTPDEPPPPAADQPRRQRAPTITIDTSAVSTPPAADEEASQQPMSLRPQMVSRSGSEASNSSNVDAGNASIPRVSSTSNRSQGSFEGSDRPTSPHNVSSPTSKSNDKPGAFLSVPGRERQDSVDSDEASYGGETYVQNGTGSSSDREHINNDHIIKDEDALTPDPGTEEDFQRDDNKFAFTPGQLNKLINPKSLSAFYSLGGLDGIVKGLRTDRDSGLSVEETFLEGTVSVDNVKTPEINGIKKASRTGTSGSHATKKGSELFSDRKRVFQDNRLPEKKGKSIFEIMWITYNDKVLILLSIAALISLAVGLYQSFGQKHETDEPRIEWLEGVAIIVAIVIVVVVGSVNDYQKERQFVKLNKKKQDRDVKVIRSGKSREISVFDILVGDIVLLEPGDMVPVDGIFIDGHNIKCDESSATGESDIIKKRPASEVYEAIKSGQDTKKLDPFILSGANVTEGVGRFVVTSTGVNSSYGKIMMSLREDPEVTPLQSKLNVLAEYIAKLGGAAGLLLFVVLFIKFLAQLPHNDGTASEKGQQFLSIFIVTVTIIVVAVPEGLPLAVTLALAFATTRMLKDNNLVRHLKACEVMGNATAICSDKTGTLTQNKMQVVAGTVGTSSRFGGTTEPQSEDDDASGGDRHPPEVLDNISAKEVAATLDDDVQVLLRESIAINSTAFEGLVDGEQTFIGSKTETALLIFAKEQLGLGPVSEERSNVNTLQFIPFDSGRKCMGVVISTGNGKARLLVKGASEILLDQCSRVIRDPTQGVEDIEMTEENRKTLNGLITSYAERSLRTIGMIYRDFEQWPPKDARRTEGESSEVQFEDIFKDMTLLSIVGIQDPLRDGVREAVEVCQKAGVVVRMVTGDNLTTAKAIAADCGIFTPGGVVMEGPTFRKLTKKQMDQIIPSLQVLARSSPEDKRILVKRLKALGETVAVTGDGTNDAPALKGADVGFSMGIAGTEVAKEASAIILMDDNFASIVKAMMWGRAVNDAVKKFLQFQITVNITAVVVTFITAVSSSTEKSALTAVQLLWVNLIMDTMAALALATDPPTRSILDRKPEPKSAPLISLRMWKMIIGEAIYQLVITFMLYFGAASIFSYNTPPKDPSDLSAPPAETQLVGTLVFNTFVWMQIFNQWNNRRLDNKFNIFEGVQNNYFFIGINIIMVGLQILIIFVGGKAFSVERLDARGWGYSIAFGFLSIPIGAAIRCVPDELVRKFVPEFLLRSDDATPELTIEDAEEQSTIPKPLTDVREELSFLKKMKGGRINNLRFKVNQAKDNFISRSRSGSRSRSNSVANTGDAEDAASAPPTTAESRKRGRAGRSRSNSALGATTVMAGIIAGSVAGWSPVERPHDDAGWARGRADLEATPGVELHPGTKPSDNVIVEEPQDTEADLPPSQREDVPHPRPASEGSEESKEEKGDKDTKP
ncbi:hypothetical protein V497_09054 [Pseudogymnoascus sp. VKM F-4516 (FW-969)]|nr:hypothetical protein V497_09054 [Pseudogymnoascus sp. VKM F-4516 (FW-969)]